MRSAVGEDMTRKKKTIIIISVIASVFLTVLIIWTVWANSALELNTYTVQCDLLPESFSGFRIAHVSDLHNAEMGKDNEKLLQMLRLASPDIIAITGDMIDSRNTDVKVALRFAEGAVNIAPCYYVTGNHESRVSEYHELKEGLSELGVCILEDKCVELEREGMSLCIAGVNDPAFSTDMATSGSSSVMADKLSTLIGDSDAFYVLLSHRPELFDVYVKHGADIVLCGHAHGGQFRLPFVGGLIAHGQGFFPEYDAGVFTSGETNMIVSKGIGNSIIPLRINNRPEVVLVELVGG